MGVTSFSGSTTGVSFSFKPTATNSNITSLKFNSNNQPNFEHTFVAHVNVDKGWITEKYDKFKNFAATTGATLAVGVGAVYFGVAKFGETIVDANVNVRAWAKSGFYQFFGNDEAAARVEKRATDFIARDLTGEAKEEFYENTSLGRAINEKSYMKYDSETANKIQNISQKATEIGVEVAAATLIPGGGVALSAAIGGVSGMGKSAEKNYQAGNSMKESALDIVINTGTGALEGYAAGAMGSAAINGAKALSNLGIDGAKALAKEKFSSFSGRVALDTLKKNAGTVAKQSIVSTLKDPGFYLDTFGASSNDIMKAAKGETSWLDAGKALIINTGVSFGTNYLFNYAGGVGNSVFDSANYGHRIDEARDSYFGNPDITEEILGNAEANYFRNADDFTGADTYFSTMDEVEKHNQWVDVLDEKGNVVIDPESGRPKKQKVVYGPDEEGLTKCMTEEAKLNFFDELKKSTKSNGKVDVNVGYNNADIFEKCVLGVEGADYGSLGYADNYNFAALGNNDLSVYTSDSEGIVSAFTNAKGTSEPKGDVILFADYDVNATDVSMHTGKEYGSNSQRLAGGRTPDGKYEVTHKTKDLSASNASNVKITSVNVKTGKTWTGTLEELKRLQNSTELVDIKTYKSIMGR